MFSHVPICRRSPRYFDAILTFGLAIPSAAYASLPQPVPVDKTWLANEHIVSSGTVVSAQRIRDKHGDHTLVLSRRAGPSPSNPNAKRIEHIELDAVFYRRAGARWKADWAIHDLVDCPDLDSSADFFLGAVTFTDLNDDGRVEVTVPYHRWRYFRMGLPLDPKAIYALLSNVKNGNDYFSEIAALFKDVWDETGVG